MTDSSCRNGSVNNIVTASDMNFAHYNNSSTCGKSVVGKNFDDYQFFLRHEIKRSDFRANFLSKMIVSFSLAALFSVFVLPALAGEGRKSSGMFL